MKSAWIGFIAARYMRRGERRSPSNVLAVLGIFTGVLALTVIIAVMNGFQLGFIESIVEVSSYHIRIEDIQHEGAAAALAEEVRALRRVRAAVPFREIQALVRGRRDDPRVAVIRGIPADAREADRGMAEKLEIVMGNFDIAEPGSILLGAELAFRLGVQPGDTVHLVSISGSGFLEQLAGGGEEAASDDGADTRFRVTGLFETGYYDYDTGWGFVNAESARALIGEDENLSLGIKLSARWQDAFALEEIRALPAYRALAEGGIAGAARPWRDYNRAFYGALRTEKLLMFFLVGLIFVVVGLNIYQAQRRQVLERCEEIGLLRAVGAGERALRLVFVWDGFVTGLSGAVAGIVPGLLIASNIGAFFSALESAVNGIAGLVNSLAALAGGNSFAGDFAVFSPAVFYIKEIPSRIIPYEAALIFFFGVISAAAAAWFASARVTRITPAEVLRDE